MFIACGRLTENLCGHLTKKLNPSALAREGGHPFPGIALISWIAACAAMSGMGAARKSGGGHLSQVIS